jgi:CBS domain-containing protein
MKKNQPIEKVLSRDVVTVHLGQSVSDVRKLLATNDFHHVPVVSGKKLIGMISAADILGISVEGVGSDTRSMDAYLDHQFSIEEIMVRDLQTLPIQSTIAQAADALADGSFHALPVVDGEGDLVGLVTTTDLIRYLRDLF